jgi:hypothetical protein
MSLSINTGNVVTFDTTALRLPTDLVVWWSIHFWVTLDLLTVYVTLLCNCHIPFFEKRIKSGQRGGER